MGGNDIETRALGGLLGVHAGDALGAALEFMDWASIRSAHPDGLLEIVGGGPFRWKPGAATDDTDLTRAVAVGYREHFQGGGELVRTVADLMLDWWHGRWPGRKPGQYPKDIGHATATGLRSYQHHGDPRRSGAGHGSAGNGSLMRCIATGIVRADADVRRAESVAISAITHDDERCTRSCAVYNDVISCLVGGGTADEAARTAADSALATGNAALQQAVARGLAMDLAVMAQSGDTRLPDGGRGFVLDSLSIACAALVDRRSFEDVIVDVARLGGDTDTNAAIAGGVRGALDGSDAIPRRWVDKLQFGVEFRELAATLAAHRR